MIKIISKKEYKQLINDNGMLLLKVSDLQNKLNDRKTEIKEYIKERTALKSKITRLENQIKKMQDEESKHKKLVKETLKEVHEEHKKRVGRPRKESK